MKRATMFVLIWLLLPLLSYASAWAFIYRLPSTDVAPIDRRRSAADVPYTIELRASLASNPHGFPGHAYVVWSDGSSAGFVPRYASDQVPSLIRAVPGFLHHGSKPYNGRNSSRVIVIVSRADYERTKSLVTNWNTTTFKVGERDCVALIHALANQLRLRCPSPCYCFPQDYIQQLKRLNAVDYSTWTATANKKLSDGRASQAVTASTSF